MLHRRRQSAVHSLGHIGLPGPGGPRTYGWAEPTLSLPNLTGLQRVVRLVIAAGVAAAGVCLVLAMTALAVTLGSTRSGPADSPVRASQTGDSSDRAPGGPDATGGAGRQRADQTVAVLRGTGQPAHGAFLISYPGTWGLAWAFRCPAGRSGSLVVAESAGATRDHIDIDASGRAGHGITWDAHDPGRHSLAITSSCAWTVRVVLPRAS